MGSVLLLTLSAMSMRMQRKKFDNKGWTLGAVAVSNSDAGDSVVFVPDALGPAGALMRAGIRLFVQVRAGGGCERVVVSRLGRSAAAAAAAAPLLTYVNCAALHMLCRMATRLRAS